MVEVSPIQFEEITDESGNKKNKLVKDAVYEKIIVYETIPAHQCEDEATSLERDLEEVDLEGIQGTSYKILADRPKCTAHASGGSVKLLNGMTGNTPVMSIMDDSGIRS